MVTVYNGTFKKQDNTQRSMRFVKVSDLPYNIQETVSRKQTTENGRELVWDIDKKSFRYYNWNTTVGNVSQTQGNVSFS